MQTIERKNSKRLRLNTQTDRTHAQKKKIQYGHQRNKNGYIDYNVEKTQALNERLKPVLTTYLSMTL